MNLNLLRRLRRVLRVNAVPEERQYAVLRALLAARLAGEKETWPNAFFPDGAPLPSAALNAAQKLLAKCAPAPEGTPGAFTPEILALSNELFSRDRRATGIFYTPFPVAKRLARETLFTVLTRQAGLPPDSARALLEDANAPAGLSAAQARETDRFLQQLAVCDPAAGAGGLLIPFALALTALRRKLSPAPEGEILTHILTHNLYAADLSARALSDLQLRFAFLLAAHGVTPRGPAVLPHMFEGDALAARANGQSVWRARFPRVFSQKQGFDVMLSNPPYVGQKNHRAVFDALRQNPLWKNRVEPKSDLLYFFFYLALDLLRPGGTGGFLTTPYFATAEGARSLRRELQNRTAFLRLVDFEDERLFEQAAGQHSLLSVFEKNADTEKPPCQTGEGPLAQQKLYEGPSLYLQTRPADGPGGTLSGALAKMAACKQTLSDVARVSNGLMTGCDKISAAHLRKTPMPGVHKGEGVFVLDEREKNALSLNAAERKKLKPFFKNSSIHPYAADKRPSGWLVDFFYPGDRELDFSLYPALRAHLARFRAALLARKQNNNGIHKQLQNGVYWFGSVRRKMDFDAEKLAVPHRAARNTFAFAPGPWYASSDVYFISAPAKGISLWYLLALFNSAPYFAWLFYKGKRKGRLLELYSAPLNALPVPAAPAEVRRKLETLARRMHRLAAQNPAADITGLQQKADELVGTLFGFTAEELRAAARLRPEPRAARPKKL